MIKIVECVPNFSEGKDLVIIKQITDAIEAVEGVRLLDVDPGADTNRTVVTFAGSPEAVEEAAFQAIKMAKQLIDMRKHKGEHPRFGATDVCPFIPVSGVTMDDCVVIAQRVGERVGKELSYPVYLYEAAASKPERKNLAFVRSGEYEGLAAKLSQTEHFPDYGPAAFVPETGAIAIGARDFLLAVNFNLNTTSTRRANAVAFDVREAGRLLKEKSAAGETIETRVPGTCKGTKAIGWFIEQYGIAQVSMNITDRQATPLHIAFEEVQASAHRRGMRVTGTEVVGLLPLSVLIDAGKYFLRKQERSLGVSESELIKIAVKSMGLDDLKPFEPEKKVLEYFFRSSADMPLANKSLIDFALETSSESPAPGGGSVSAYMSAMGVSLATMVANLSSHKRGWDDKWELFSNYAEKGMTLQTKLLGLIDKDTASFNAIMSAFALPKNDDAQKAARSEAIQSATRFAMEIPFEVAKLSLEAFSLCEMMAEEGNQNSLTDAAVGALALRAGGLGAALNVRINASGYTADVAWKENLLAELATIEEALKAREMVLTDLVMQKLS